jgi:putative FmdB family regulatory protein
MPTYRYRCSKCGETFELWQSIHDEPLRRHPGCGGKVDKVFGVAGIVLKGSGFYKTDSRAGAKTNGSGDGKPAEAKPSETTPSERSTSKAASSEGSGGAKESKGSRSKPADT